MLWVPRDLVYDGDIRFLYLVSSDGGFSVFGRVSNITKGRIVSSVPKPGLLHNRHLNHYRLPLVGSVFGLE
jgi:hypothetical protein